MTYGWGSTAGWPSATVPGFGDDDLLDALEGVPLERLDDLGFGLIAMDRAGDVIWYNTFEAQRAGLRALRMRPTPVRLRLLARSGSARQYLAVRNR